MVELRLDALLDEFEIDDHAVLIQLASLAIDGDGPIVAVQLATLTGIRQLKMVAGRYDQTFAYVIHPVNLRFDYLLITLYMQFGHKSTKKLRTMSYKL